MLVQKKQENCGGVYPMFCKECGAPLEEGARFCSECGAKADVDDKNVYKEAFNQAKADIKSGAGKAGACAKDIIGKAEGVTKQTFETAGSAVGAAVSDVEDTLGRATSSASSSNMTPEEGHALRTNRNVIALVLLSIITCNIYSYYNIYAIARDVNIACFDDDENTPGLLVYILLSFVTCGFYNLYWLYKIGNRLSVNASHYGVEMREDGSHIILWKILGLLICCIGSYYGDYILLKNTNLICDAYNKKYGYSPDEH
jgi:hypothetical protein